MKVRYVDWRRVLLAVLCSVVLVACSNSDGSDETAVEQTPIATEIDIVSAEGQLVPKTAVLLSFQSGGQVITILVEEGQSVTAGAPLVQLDSTDQQIGVRQAEAAVTQAEANITTANASLLSSEAGLEAAQIGVMAAEAQLALVTADPTEAQIALSEASLAIAQAGIGQAEGNQALVLEGGGSSAIAAAEAQLVAAQAQYDQAQKSYIPILQNEDISDEEVIEQAQLQLNVAEANLAAAEANLQEARAGNATVGDRTAAAAGVDVALNQLGAAQAQYDALLAGAKGEQIALAETGIEQAQNGVAEAELQVAAAETAVTQAEAALVEAQAALAAAQSALDKQTLRATFAGTIAGIAVKEGQVVAPGVPVVTLADLSAWQVETTDLTELSVVNISRGDVAEISLDAFPDVELDGRIEEISSVSTDVRGDVTYLVTLSLDDVEALPLRWGMTAFVTVDTEQ